MPQRVLDPSRGLRAWRAQVIGSVCECWQGAAIHDPGGTIVGVKTKGIFGSVYCTKDRAPHGSCHLATRSLTLANLRHLSTHVHQN